MRFNADGVWLSDGTKLDRATWRTLKLLSGKAASKRQREVAGRIIAAVNAAHGKRWSPMELAAWLDNAIGTDEVDGGALLLVLAQFDRHLLRARARNASAANVIHSEEQREDYRRRARDLLKGDPTLSQRDVARRLEDEVGIPAETGRGYLKPKRKPRKRKK